MALPPPDHGWLAPVFDGIPAELRALPRWVVWRAEQRNGRMTKVPYAATSGSPASTTDPSTWSSFEQACGAYERGRHDGVGFVFCSTDGLVGVDLDHVRDASSGEIELLAAERMRSLRSYSEVSPSGTGLHIIARARLPAKGRRKGTVEMYESERYFAITGVRVDGAPTAVEDRQPEIDALHREVFGASKEGTDARSGAPTVVRPVVSDDVVLERARRAKNGPKFRALFDDGDITGYPSESEATLALCSLLAYRTEGDSAAVDRLFRRSKLMREKWDAPRGDSTWGAQTIETAIASLKRLPPAKSSDGTLRPHSAPPDVLTLGPHTTSSGDYFEVGTDDFARTVLDTFAEDVLYRMDHIVGQIVGERGTKRFLMLDANQLRLLIDEHARLVKWVRSRETKERVKTFVACSRDQALLVLAAASVSPRVRELQQLVNYPVYLPGFELATAGWNERGGVFYDEPTELAGLVPSAAGALETLDDLVIDFPLKDEASRQNLYGLMLTAILRPAIDGPIPFHLVMASIERTGKGKLIDATLGAAIRGQQVTPIQLGATEEEREKRLTTLIFQGATAAHFDNLPGGEVVDSAALASFATAWPRWRGRILGSSSAPELPNRLLVVLSGNNPKATGELCKRNVPIHLESKTPKPELRSDFRHPDILDHAKSVRRPVLGALLGIVEAWKIAGRPGTARRMGGFERWAAAVGGALASVGAVEWMANYEAWIRVADDASADAVTLVEAWSERHGTAEVTATQVLSLVEATHTFPHVLATLNPHGRAISLRRRVLDRLVDRPVSRWIVRRKTSGSSSTHFLSEGVP